MLYQKDEKRNDTQNNSKLYNNNLRKNNSMRNKNSFDKIFIEKKLNRDYIEKLCVLLNSNDKNYYNKRFNLGDLVLKMNESNQEYLTRKDFNKKNSKENNKNNSVDNIKSYSLNSVKEKKEKEKLYNLVSVFKKKNDSLNEKIKEKENNNLNLKETKNFENIYNLLKSKENKFINKESKLNNSQNNISKISYSNLNYSEEIEKEELKNLNIYRNANKLISKVKLIREYKNNFKKMDCINLFSFKNSVWNHKKLFNNESIKKEEISYSKKQILPEIIFKIFKKENNKYKESKKKK